MVVNNLWKEVSDAFNYAYLTYLDDTSTKNENNLHWLIRKTPISDLDNKFTGDCTLYERYTDTLSIQWKHDIHPDERFTTEFPSDHNIIKTSQGEIIDNIGIKEFKEPDTKLWKTKNLNEKISEFALDDKVFSKLLKVLSESESGRRQVNEITNILMWWGAMKIDEYLGKNQFSDTQTLLEKYIELLEWESSKKVYLADETQSYKFEDYQDISNFLHTLFDDKKKIRDKFRDFINTYHRNKDHSMKADVTLSYTQRDIDVDVYIWNKENWYMLLGSFTKEYLDAIIEVHANDWFAFSTPTSK